MRFSNSHVSLHYPKTRIIANSNKNVNLLLILQKSIFSNSYGNGNEVVSKPNTPCFASSNTNFNWVLLNKLSNIFCARHIWDVKNGQPKKYTIIHWIRPYKSKCLRLFKNCRGRIPSHGPHGLSHVFMYILHLLFSIQCICTGK